MHKHSAFVCVRRIPCLPTTGSHKCLIVSDFERFKSTAVMQELKVSNNQMAASGAQSLAPALYGMKDLHVLDVSSNLLGTIGVTTLSEALVHLKKLQVLVVGQNSLRETGTCARHCIWEAQACNGTKGKPLCS